MNSTTPETLNSSRPFDGVIIALSASLLVIFGIVIGRFVVSTQAVEVVDHFDAEFDTLRAEMSDLKRQLSESEARVAVLQNSADEYRSLAAKERLRADALAGTQQRMEDSLAMISRHRDECVGQIQQYVALNQPIAATDVLVFAEQMFETHTNTLRQLGGADTRRRLDGDSPFFGSGQPQFPQLRVSERQQRGAERRGDVAIANSRHVRNSVNSHNSADHRYGGEYHSVDRLPKFAATEASTASVSGVETAGSHRGAFFAPPTRRKSRSRYTFFAPHREEAVIALPKRSGFSFLDTAGADTETVRR